MRTFLLLVLSLTTACSRGGSGQRHPKESEMNVGNQCRHSLSYDTNSKHKETIKDDCQTDFNLTAYRTARTTISCDCRRCNSTVKFFCKDNGSTCEDILKSPQMSNGTFTFTETSRGFNISIGDVSSQHAGVYRCGLEDEDGKNRASLRRIQLKVENITIFKKFLVIGENLTYYCLYEENTNTKFICKGEDPSLCEHLANTTQSSSNNRFTMKDNKKKKVIAITVRDVTMEDTGTYWCGAESTDKTLGNTFYYRYIVTVGHPAGSPPVVLILIVCVVVLMMLLLLHILIHIYRRYSKNKRKAAVQRIKEEYIYEEIRERPQNPDSRQEMNNIYVNVNFPTNPSVPLHYSTVNFQRGSGDAGVEAPLIRPSYSVCEYSTVKEDPLYSTVNKPPRP